MLKTKGVLGADIRPGGRWHLCARLTLAFLTLKGGLLTVPPYLVNFCGCMCNIPACQGLGAHSAPGSRGGAHECGALRGAVTPRLSRTRRQRAGCPVSDGSIVTAVITRPGRLSQHGLAPCDGRPAPCLPCTAAVCGGLCPRRGVQGGAGGGAGRGSQLGRGITRR